MKWFRWLWPQRSSLSMRIACMVMISGLIMVLLCALLVQSKLGRDVFNERRNTILADASVRFSSAELGFDQSTAATPDEVQELIRRTVTGTLSSAAGAGAVSVFLLNPPSASSGSTIRINEVVNTKLLPVITKELRTAVRDEAGGQWQSVAIPDTDENRQTPAIVTGAKVTIPHAGSHEMYIIYSLKAEFTIIQMVLRALTIGILPLIIILPMVLFGIIYHLLSPVRRTVSAATKLAHGDLKARVVASGADEMARLGNAFNDMADSLQKTIAQYDDLARLQQRFVSDVSHELRTPLTTIRMADEMIWEDRDLFSPSTKRSAELLHEQVARFDSMLADLLEISRYDARSALLDPESVDMRSLVKKAVTETRELAHRLHVDVRVDAPEDPCTVELDIRRIDRVLRNLLVNAIEHAEHRPVDISVAMNAHDIAVRVDDQGIGMSEATVLHVFDRFFRGDWSRVRTTGGTGLGLSIALEDVTLHNGKIEAWGILGQGSSFLVILPRKLGQPVQSYPLDLSYREG